MATVSAQELLRMYNNILELNKELMNENKSLKTRNMELRETIVKLNTRKISGTHEIGVALIGNLSDYNFIKDANGCYFHNPRTGNCVYPGESHWNELKKLKAA